MCYLQADACTCPHDPAVIVPIVPRSTHHRQASPALVRRIGGCLDDLSRVLSTGTTAWLYLRALAHSAWRSVSSVSGTRLPLAHKLPGAAHHPRAVLATRHRLCAGAAHSGPLGCDRRIAVLSACIDGTTSSEMAERGCKPSRAAALHLSLVRAVQSRLTDRIAELSLCH